MPSNGIAPPRFPMRHRGRTASAIITIPRFVALFVFVVNILYSIKGQYNASYSFFMLDDAPKHDDFASGHSAFVPMESIPEAERQIVPGLFYYGIGNVSKTPLVVTGAAMAGDYHDSNALWLHLFGMGENMFKESNRGECFSRDERKNGVPLSGGGFHDLRTFAEMKDEVFLCRIGTRTARFELMPTNSYDGNTNEIAQVWRCPLHGIPGRKPVLSDSDFRQLRRHSTDHNTVLTIDVLYEGAGLTSVLRLHLPIAEPSLGIQRMLSHMPAKPSFIHERHNVTLCTVAHANGIRYLNEFIRYHHDVVGIDHIHLGLLTNFGEAGKEQAMQMHNIVGNLLFGPDVAAGTLSVSALWDEDFDFQCTKAENQKMVFYQQCLYRAKGTSEFIATWDLDEFFHLKGAEEMTRNGRRKLPDFLRGIEHPECRDWSYVTMLSAFSGGSDGVDTGLRIRDRPRQTYEANDVWQKSIIRTKNVFHNTFHLPGACLPPGKSNISDAIGMHPIHNECAFYTHDAIMIHANYWDKTTVNWLASEVLDSVLAHGELGNR